MQYIQPSFTSGELSPELQSRVDITKYASGLKTAQNAIVGKSGGIFNRPGSYYVGAVKDSTKIVRLIPFEASSVDSYQIEFGDGYFRFFKNHAAVTAVGSAAYSAAVTYAVDEYVTYDSLTYRCIQAGTDKTPDTETDYWTETLIYEISHPFDEADLFEVKFVQSADVMYMVHRDYEPQQLTRYSDNVWTIEDLAYENGPFMISNSDSANTITPNATSGVDKTLTAVSDTFVAGHVGALWRLRQWTPANAYCATLTADTDGTAMRFQGTWRLLTKGTWTGTLYIEKSANGTDNWYEVAQFKSTSDFNIDTYGTETDITYIRARLDWDSGTNIQINLRTDGFTNTGIARITSVTTAKIAVVDILENFSSTTATADWAEGSWSTYRGFPGTIMFFQDRLCPCSSTYEPQAIWMSKASQYLDFGISNPMVDSDAISISLPSRKLNAIQNVTGLKQMMGLTNNTIWSVKGVNGVITPTTVETNLEEYRGSNAVDPVMIGNRIMFVQPIGATFRELNYDFDSNSFNSSNISILSEHLFKDHTIIESCYQQEPYSAVYAVRDDGIMLVMTYMRDQEVLAWTRIITDGLYESVATIPGESCNEVWAIVNRGGTKYIEYFKERSYSDDPADQYYVDGGYTWDVPYDIEDITTGATTEITITGHPFDDDDIVEIVRVIGVDDEDGESVLNHTKFIVANKTADTFEIKTLEDEDLDTSESTDYISSGEVRAVNTAISGLTWLEGETVAILADGNVLPQQEVVDGAIDLSPGYARVHVGLPYTFEIETLKPELNIKEGTVQGKKLKISKVILRVVNSRGGYIGPDEDNLVEFIQRTEGGDAIDLVTSEVESNAGGYYSNEGNMIIRQVDPLPMNIVALIPEVTIGG